MRTSDFGLRNGLEIGGDMDINREGALGTFILTVHCGGRIAESETIDDRDALMEESKA